MPIFRIHIDGKGGEHNYASNRTKQMRSILARTNYLPETDPQKENPPLTSHTTINTPHQNTRQICKGLDLQAASGRGGPEPFI